MLVIDGSQGEGGGQVLRSSLSLSLLTGTPFRIEKIRAGRRRPGLMRQHLTAVQAAAEISGAQVVGDTLGSTELSFAPGTLRPGDYSFSIGSAGSTSLVLQTILPALALAEAPSTVELRGGTHNPFAPPFDFLVRTLFPLIERMGPRVEGRLHRPGYYPAGGGHVVYRVQPVATLLPVSVIERGAIHGREIEATVSVLPSEIGAREVAAMAEALGWDKACASVTRVTNSTGPGNVLTAIVRSEHVTEVFTGFGEKGIAAEEVARSVARETQAYLDADAPVGQHLADQLLLWMAIAGEGRFRTLEPTEHTRTQCDVIGLFLDVAVDLKQDGDTWLVSVRSSNKEAVASS